MKAEVKRGRILVVEDDPALLKVIATSLEKHLGVHVSSAVDGRAAIAALAAEPPDVVCLDLMLPDVSGFAVCEHIRLSPSLRHTAIVVISARSMPEDRARALELGASAYLVKPFRQAELRGLVGGMLEARKVGFEAAG